jgi:proteasome assembly chaperone (PAC2) family protein
VRPKVTLQDGYVTGLAVRRNEVFYAGINNKGILLFIGDEPHLNAEQYAKAFFELVRTLKVTRVTGVAGVYAPMPYDKDRQISCIYSLKHMKAQLEGYAMRFSNYEGGSSIGSYLVKAAEAEKIEFQVFYGMVPAYDFGQSSPFSQGIRIENDHKAWYDIMYRFEHMFNLGMDLTKLERQSRNLVRIMDKKIEELLAEQPDLPIEQYLEQVGQQFEELSFVPLDDVWERELDDLFKDMDED